MCLAFEAEADIMNALILPGNHKQQNYATKKQSPLEGGIKISSRRWRNMTTEGAFFKIKEATTEIRVHHTIELGPQRMLNSKILKFTY